MELRDPGDARLILCIVDPQNGLSALARIELEPNSVGLSIAAQQNKLNTHV